MAAFQNCILLCQQTMNHCSYCQKNLLFVCARSVQKKKNYHIVSVITADQTKFWFGNPLKNDWLIARRRQQGCSCGSNQVMILWNNVGVKSPICPSLCSSVGLCVKLNYASGHRANCARGRVHARAHWRMHTRSSLSLLTEGLAEWVMRKGPHAWTLTSAGRPARHTHTYSRRTLAKKSALKKFD